MRAGCAWVVGRAGSVRIVAGEIEAYASTLPCTGDSEEPSTPADPEAAAAFAICMNAINFGSGWWPTIRKRPAHSGYATMAAGVEERFAGVGPWTAAELVALDADAIAAVVGQDPEHPLMPQFAAALRDVPHILRVDGVLKLDPDLIARIEGEALLTHGSPEEVELRACAVHAIELLAATSNLTPAEIDSALWNRGRDPRYKSLPRPRSRNTAY